jgi:hypothetical protein
VKGEWKLSDYMRAQRLTWPKNSKQKGGSGYLHKSAKKEPN